MKFSSEGFCIYCSDIIGNTYETIYPHLVSTQHKNQRKKHKESEFELGAEYTCDFCEVELTSDADFHLHFRSIHLREIADLYKKLFKEQEENGWENQKLIEEIIFFEKDKEDKSREELMADLEQIKIQENYQEKRYDIEVDEIDASELWDE